jgi:hypothetical protein
MKRLYNFLLPLLLWAPDGAGGGGDPPGDVSLEEWIGRLNEAEKKDRAALVGELAKALGVKVGEAYKKLKDAGWDPKTADTMPPGGDPPPSVPPRTETVTLRHKTSYPRYRRAGLLLTGQFKPYAVTAAQLAALKADTWVEVREPPKSDTP